MATRGLWLGLLFALLAVTPTRAVGPFDNWAAIVVAGDWRGEGGAATEAFDNARRDVARTLQAAGFSPGNVRQFSVRPERYADTQPLRAEPRLIYQTLMQLTQQASGGCLIYFTSHGAPQGVVVGDDSISPQSMARLVSDACGERPTIVVISACFSGVFVPALAEPNHMVMTAARPDRSSFGCGVANKYPYFDDCFLTTARTSGDFIGLARGAVACVAQKEVETNSRPPSEPQVYVGARLRPMLPLLSWPATTAPR
jgi:hypothetical protein